jgi:hypothetical protein
MCESSLGLVGCIHEPRCVVDHKKHDERHQSDNAHRGSQSNPPVSGALLQLVAEYNQDNCGDDYDDVGEHSPPPYECCHG